MPSAILRPFLVVALVLSAVPAQAIETPRYRVERTLADGIEVRRYEPMLLAETTVATTDYRRAGNEAFRVLANYIFGDNQGRRDIAMTAPVEQRASEAGWTVTFMMPSEWQRETLPLPNDARVVIRELPERRIAAIRFSGTWSAKAFAAREAELVDAVTRAGLVMVGEPWTARYDPPWTPWFMRRNEILVELEPGTPADG
jgi:lipocalin